MHQMRPMAANGTYSEMEQVEQSSSSSKKESAGKGKEIAARKGITRPPLNFLAILHDAEISIDMSFPNNLCDKLYAGVYLKPNKLKYFVDKKSNKNCFVLFARELEIAWGGSPEYWKWTKEKGTSDEEDIEVAELLNVCWLEVRGRNTTIDLSPGAVYEIVLVVRMLDNPSDGHISNFTVKLTIVPPRTKQLIRYESFKEKPFGNWFEIQVGEFKMSSEYIGKMQFSLEEYSPTWKNGLCVKCAIIRPKKE